MKNHKFLIGIIFAVIIVILLAIAGVGGWHFYKYVVTDISDYIEWRKDKDDELPEEEQKNSGASLMFDEAAGEGLWLEENLKIDVFIV